MSFLSNHYINVHSSAPCDICGLLSNSTHLICQFMIQSAQWPRIAPGSSRWYLMTPITAGNKLVPYFPRAVEFDCTQWEQHALAVLSFSSAYIQQCRLKESHCFYLYIYVCAVYIFLWQYTVWIDKKSRRTLVVVNIFFQLVHLAMHHKVLPSLSKTSHNTLPLWRVVG